MLGPSLFKPLCEQFADALVECDRATIERMLQKNVNINESLTTNVNFPIYAVHVASGNKHDSVEVVKLVLSLMNVPDAVNIRSMGANTPLMIASRSGNQEVAEYLIKRGADQNARNNKGKTAYDLSMTGRLEKSLAQLVRSFE